LIDDLFIDWLKVEQVIREGIELQLFNCLIYRLTYRSIDLLIDQLACV